MTGVLTLDGGTLRTTADLTSARAVTLGAAGGTIDTGGHAAVFGGVFSGAGALTTAGTGSLTLTGDNSYSGGTTIAAGTLQLGNGGNTGSLVGTIVNSAALVFNRSDAVTFGGVVSGGGSLTQRGPGTLILTGANTYTGGTTIFAGTLQLGTGGTTGSVGSGPISNNGVLIVNRSDVVTLAQVMSGSGLLTQHGPGTLTLTGANTYTGATTVAAGTLLINGTQTAATGAISVASGATLGGTGTTGGTVTVANGGHLVGAQGQPAFTMNALTLNPTSQVDISLANPGTTGLFSINGNLVLDGVLNITATGAFGPGVYRVMDYTGALTNNGLTFGTVPAGFTPNIDLFVQTAVAQQVNLVNAQGAGPLTFWDGNDPALFNNGAINGGTGTWLAAPANDAWTTSAGDINTPWLADGFAVFQGTAGVVTVDNNAGAVTFSGAQFAVNGYSVTGQALTTTTADTILRVGDGLPTGAAMTATIGAVIQGTGGLHKTDLGTLVLSAANTYTGGTIISGGRVSIASDANLGATTGGLTLNGGTLLTTAILTSARAVTVGAAGGTIDNGGFLNTFTAGISGSGALMFSGAGTSTLSGDNTYTGGTTVTAGTLRIGNGGTSGSLVGDLVNNGTLAAFQRSDAVTFAGVVSGTGMLSQQGLGTLTLTGANTYSGATLVTAGTLLINGTQTAATGAVSVGAGATLGGTGTTGGTVTVADGGHLLGAQGQPAFTMSALTLNPTSQVDISLANPGTTGLFFINGNLVLDGVLNITATGAFGPGVYRAMDYTGALTDNTVDFGTVPAGALPGIDLFVQTSVATQVNLINSFGVALTVWDGGTTALHDNAAVNGGDGVWSAAADRNWTQADGAINGRWSPGAVATFAGVGGTVTVDNTSGAVSFSGATFTADGYTIAGQPLTTTTAATPISVGAGMTATMSAVLQGSGGGITKIDPGTLVLAGANTYTAGTTINGGTLSIASDANLGAATGTLTFNGGTLRTTAAVTSGRSVTLAGNGTVDNNGVSNTLSGAINGTGAFAVTGTGVLVLTGTNTYTGGTTIAASTVLALGNSTATGTVVGPIVNNGLLQFAHTAPITQVGAISGTGSLEKFNANTLTLTGDNSYTGTTTIVQGTLQVGAGGTTGSVGSGPIVDNAALVVNRSNLLALGQIVSGTGTLTQAGPGTLTLTGANTYTGATTVAAGTLLINGTQAAATGGISVASGAALGGTGTTGATVTVADGGHLLGVQGQTFTMNGLMLNPTSQVDISLASPSTAGLFTVNGNLVLDGVLNVAATGAFGPGVYRVMDYTGALTNNGLGFGTVPAGFTPNVDLFVQTAVAQQVNLINAQVAGPLTFWDGNDPALFNNGVVNGGTGSWLAAPANNAWTTSAGDINGPWLPNGFAIFQGTPGTVSVDNSAGAVTFSGAQFAVNGYTVTGQALTTTTADTILRVGDGLPTGAAMTATIGAVIQGTGGLNKTDLGTLVLSAANAYTGGTIISGGRVSITGDANLGAATGGLTLNGGTLLTTANVTSARTVALGAAGGTIDNGGHTALFGGVFSGAGALTAMGTGTLALTGDNTYSGGTTIAAGILQLGNGATSGSITGNIADNAGLVFHRSDDVAFAGVVSGSGTLTQRGPGTLSLTAANTYAGATTVAAGTLLINGTQTAATGAVSVAAGARLGGTGTTGGTVTVADGGHLIGVQGQTFAMNALTLNPTSQVDISLANPGTTGLFSINGNLVLDGVLNITPTGAFGPGVYRVMDYTGALTNNGLNFGAVPAGVTPNVDLFVQTAVAHQVNLVNAQGAGGLTFWDGNDPALFSDGVVNGGTGSWVASPANDAWTNSAGVTNGSWLPNGFAIFQGTPGTVTVDNSAGAVTFSGAQFAVNGYTVTGQALTTNTPDTILRVGDGLPGGAAMTATIGAVIQGTGGIHKTDLGTLVLTAANTYTGGTIISGGRVSITSDANLGAASGALILNGGTLVTTANVTLARAVELNAAGGTIDNGGFASTFTARIGSTGPVTFSGAGTTTLTGDNTYTGGTIVTAGTLRIGNGGTSGSLIGDIVNNGTLAFQRSDAVTFAGVVSGTGMLAQQGRGALMLTGANTYAGATSVTGGTLLINGNQSGATGAVSVGTGATLGGTGTTGGVVTIASGAHLAPGASPGTLTTGGLVLLPGALLDYELNTPGVVGGATNDLMVVNGNLVLDGVLNITGAFAPGTYRLMNYTGALTDNTLDVGTVPGGALPGIDLFVQTSVAHQVNLINSAGLALTVWDGGTTALHDNGAVNGGDGIWSATSNRNWTQTDGLVNGRWSPGAAAIFQGVGGTVTVDNGSGPVTFSGATFAADGYTIAGQALTTTTAKTFLQVGDATFKAMIASVIQGTGGVDKTGAGTLILTGDNGYTGGTTITGGTLVATNANALGTGLVQNDAALIFDVGEADSGDFVNVLAGTGSLTKVNSGNVTLTNPASQAGTVTIAGGQLTFAQTGAFTINTGGFTIGNGAAAVLTVPATLDVATRFTVGDTGTLVAHLPPSLSSPKVLAASADLGRDSTLVVNGFSPDAVSRASQVDQRAYTLIHTTGGITGDFAYVTIVGAALPDYLSATAGKANGGRDYDLGLRLRWYEDQEKSYGTFTVSSEVAFDVDVPLSDVAPNPGFAWDGQALTKRGSGSLTLSAVNTYTGVTGIVDGTLALAGAGDIAASSGVDLAATGTIFTIAGANGDRTIQDLFGSAGSSVMLGANTLTAGTQHNTLFAGSLVGTGGFIKQGAGAILFNGASPFSGSALVREGTLVIGDSYHRNAAFSGCAGVRVMPGAVIGGYGSIRCDVENQAADPRAVAGTPGIVAIGGAIGAIATAADPAPLVNFRIGGTFTNAGIVLMGKTGTYGDVLTASSLIGQVGTFILDTVLGDDKSPSDRIVIDGGSATGSTRLEFRTAGEGTPTTDDGILIVDAINGATTTPAAFATTRPLITPLVDYDLVRGGLNQSHPENWYLRSTYRRELSLYAAAPAVAQLYGQTLLDTLHERVGDEEGLRVRTQLKDTRWANGVWGRVVYRRGDRDGGGFLNSGPSLDYDVYALQGGVDLYRREHDNNDRDHGGLHGSAGRLTSQVMSDAGTKAGETQLDAQTFGGYWTHFGDSGWYIDGLAQISWLDAEMRSDRMTLRSHGTSPAASIEGGYPFALNKQTVLEPQVQVVYQRVTFDPARDALATITFEDSTSLAGRLGVRVARTWLRDGRRISTTWGRVNVWKEFEGRNRIDISTAMHVIPLGANLGDTWIEVGGGGDVQIFGPFTLFGSGSYQTAIEGNRSAVTGKGGLRFNW